ncbi:MAG: DUF3150 domain-containing protein [Verrucomicrobiae bacterium]|nr:DUF3150 domain-containing protein [Verrucomicrobiae bacterium]
MSNGSTENGLLPMLKREGVLLNVSIRFWRGHKKLKAQDLGLDPNNVSDRLVSLGHKRLMPKEALAPLVLIEGQAHALVEQNSFPFLNGLARFVPNARLATVTAKLKELETEFWNAKGLFLRHYEKHRATATREWCEMAQRLSTDPVSLVAAVEGAFPETLRLEQSFGFSTQLFQIAVPESLSLRLLAEGEQQAVLEARRQAAQEATRHIRQSTEGFVRECVASLREQTVLLCDEVLATIRTGKTDGVHQKTLNRLAKFMDQFKTMNFANDQELETTLENARLELLSHTAAEYRDNAHAQNQLTEGLTRLRDTAREMARQDATEIVQRFGEMGKRKFHLAA